MEIVITTRNYIDRVRTKGRPRHYDVLPDYYNLNIVIAHTIVKNVRKMRKKQSFGHPVALTSDQWNAILKQIETGFKAWLKMTDDDIFQDKEKLKALELKYKVGMDLFKEWFDSLWF